MIFSIIFYICIALSSAALLELGRRTEGRLKGVCAVAASLAILTFFAAIRYGVGTDFDAYMTLYRLLPGLSPWDKQGIADIGGGGIGNWAIAKVISSIGGTPLYLGVYQFFTVLFFYLGLRTYKLENHFLPMFIYAMTYYPLSLNIVKQTLAAAMMFFALRFVYKRKLIPFAVMLALAYTIHSSSLIFIPVYFIYRRENRLTDEDIRYRTIPLTCYAVVAAASILLCLAVTRAGLFGSLSEYFVNFGDSSNISFMLHSLLLLIMIFGAKSIVRDDPKLYLLLILASFGAGLEAIGFFSQVTKRLYLFFFTLPAIMILSCMYDRFVDRDRKTAQLLIMGGAVLWFMVMFALMGQGQVVPYSTVFAH